MLHVARCPSSLLQDFSIYFYLMKTNRIIFLIDGKLIPASFLLCAEVEVGGAHLTGVRGEEDDDDGGGDVGDDGDDDDDAEVQGAHVTGVRGEEEAETNRSL